MRCDKPGGSCQDCQPTHNVAMLHNITGLSGVNREVEPCNSTTNSVISAIRALDYLFMLADIVQLQSISSTQYNEKSVRFMFFYFSFKCLISTSHSFFGSVC